MRAAHVVPKALDMRRQSCSPVLPYIEVAPCFHMSLNSFPAASSKIDCKKYERLPRYLSSLWLPFVNIPY
jgi:hypothetical protein